MKATSTLTIALCCLLCIACNRSQNNRKRNPHNLALVATKSEYLKHVTSDPKFEMVDLELEIDNIVLDIRYATSNNFTGEVIYKAPKAYARVPVAKALKLLQDSLATHNLGLKIFDAYRPYAATLRFYEVYPNTEFVADPKKGSRHNRGCAIDLTLINLKSGKELEMPTSFDDFSKKAHSEYANLPEEIIKNRTFLFEILAHFGFTHIASEWWHFDFKGWEEFPLMDLSFNELTE